MRISPKVWTVPSGKNTISLFNRRLLSVNATFIRFNVFPQSDRSAPFPFPTPAVLFLFLFSLLIFPSILHSNTDSDTYPLARIDTGTIKDRATFSVERTIQLKTRAQTVSLLIEKLDLTAALVRAWELEKYRAERLEHGFYRVRDEAGLSGLVLRVSEKSGGIIYSGKGSYRTSRLPIEVEGTAIAKVAWEEQSDGEDSATRVKAKLHARINNVAVHYMGMIFFPIVKAIANNKANHLIDVTKKLIQKLKNHPLETKQRLRELDPELVPLLFTDPK